MKNKIIGKGASGVRTNTPVASTEVLIVLLGLLALAIIYGESVT